jgi:hypothetical protein
MDRRHFPQSQKCLHGLRSLCWLDAQRIYIAAHISELALSFTDSLVHSHDPGVVRPFKVNWPDNDVYGGERLGNQSPIGNQKHSTQV